MTTCSTMSQPLFQLGCLLLVLASRTGSLHGQLTAEDESDFYGTTPTFHDWDESNHTVEGFDWSMPAWVDPAPRTGVTHGRKISARGGQAADQLLDDAGYRGTLKRSLSWNWKWLEPSEGDFDFERLREAIQATSENGRYKIELKVYAAVKFFQLLDGDGNPQTSDYARSAREQEQSAPTWLADYDIPASYQNKTYFELSVYDEYHPDYHSRYLRMIEALGQSGILADDHIVSAYVHKGSPTRGEEGHGPGESSLNWPKYEERMQAWADAAGPDVLKLMTVSSDAPDLRLAARLRIGQRNGFVEHYLMHVVNADLATSITPAGYLTVNEQHPIIRDGLMSGDENEEYFLNEQMSERFGEFSSFKHRYREATLRMLQMRRRVIWDANVQGFIEPALSQFAALSLGKTVETTADAWCYLRQSDLQPNNSGTAGAAAIVPTANRNSDGSIPAKNFERWLYQRDDGQRVRTTPARPLGEGGYQLFRSPEQGPGGVDYTARRTNTGAGADRIGFALDDRFASGPGVAVALKVTYLDDNSRWRLEYPTTSGTTATRTVTGGGSGNMRTVTWLLTNAHFSASDLDNDFYLIAEQGDLTASFVRVVRLEAPGTTPPTGEAGDPFEPDPQAGYALANKGSSGYAYPAGCGPVSSGSVGLVLGPAEDADCTAFRFSPAGDDGFYVLDNHRTGGRYRLSDCEQGQGEPAADDAATVAQIGPADVTGWCAQWRFVPAGVGHYRLENRQTGQWLRVLDCSQATDGSAQLSAVARTFDGDCTRWSFPSAPLDYPLTVEGGSGSGYYLPGADVDIAADPAPEGQTFDGWVVDGPGELANPNAAATTFTTANSATTVRARYMTKQLHRIMVEGGLLPNGSTLGFFATGTELTITGNRPLGAQFSAWTLQGSGTLSDAESEQTNFLVGDAEATIAASFAWRLDVVDGTGSGYYAPGPAVEISAAQAPDGEVFANWTVDGAAEVTDASEPATSIILRGGTAVRVQATYQAQRYSVRVWGGTGSGQYASGVELRLGANVPDGGRFGAWNLEGAGTLSDRRDPFAVFTVGQGSATIRASFLPPLSDQSIAVRASGSCGSETLVLELDGVEVQRWVDIPVTGAEYRLDNQEADTIRAWFVNPGTDDASACQRALTVEYVELPGRRMLGADQRTNTGQTDAAGSCAPNTPNDVARMTCEGYVEFAPGATSSLLDDPTSAARASLAPNPARGGQQVRVTWPSRTVPAELTVDLLDARGRLVHRSTASADLSILLPSLTPGIYVVRLAAAGQAPALGRLLITE